MRITGGMANKNDRLVQLWAAKQRSFVSGKTPCVGHHIHSRYIRLLRWDLDNIIPLTYEEHALVHQGKIRINLPDDRQQRLIEKLNTNYHMWLLQNGLTEEEYVKKCNKKLKEALK